MTHFNPIVSKPLSPPNHNLLDSPLQRTPKSVVEKKILLSSSAPRPRPRFSDEETEPIGEDVLTKKWEMSRQPFFGTQ